MNIKREIPFGLPIIGEEERNSVLEVLKGSILVHGPKVKSFEKSFSEFTGSPFSLAVNSCTAALHLAYFYLGIGQGDEVIVPAQTHIATAHAVEFCNGTCVFVDSEIKTGNIDIDQIEAKITKKTKAISLVHYLGFPVEMDKIIAIADKYNLFVVEDCALSIGASFKGKHTGLWGNLGCFSFYPVKHMTTIEGGMVTTYDKDIADKIGRQRAFGVDRTIEERKVPGHYDTTMLGFNYRMNEVEAAIGIEQLKRLSGFLAKREENYNALQKEMKNISEIQLFDYTNKDCKGSYYCLSFILNEKLSNKRFEIISDLNESGIGTSIYYPQAVPLMKYYHDKYKLSAADVPIANKISTRSIALSVGPHLDTSDMQYMSDVLKKVISKYL
jgi:perosamine synthetase